MRRWLVLALLPLAACWSPIQSTTGQTFGCEAQTSNSDGFILVETRCNNLQGHHQQAGVRCKGESYLQGGNMVYTNGGISRVERFCGSLGYEYTVLVYS